MMSDSRFMEQSSILAAEVTEIRDGTKVIVQASFRSIQVEADN